MSSYRLPGRRSIVPTVSLMNRPYVFSMPIHYVVAVGTENVHGHFFHFRLSLVNAQRPDHPESMRIDMRPNLTDHSNPMHGEALVEYKAYAFSRNHGPEPFWIPMPPGMTADRILYYIFDVRKLDQYIFNVNGQGCRHWCAKILEALGGALGRSDVASTFEAYEVEEHRKFGSMFPMPRIRGDFYE